MCPASADLTSSVDGLRFLSKRAFAVTDQPVIDRARQLLVRPGLAPRDAFHAAHALGAGCDLIASTDPDFDRVDRLRRLAPTI